MKKWSILIEQDCLDSQGSGILPSVLIKSVVPISELLFFPNCLRLKDVAREQQIVNGLLCSIQFIVIITSYI